MEILRISRLMALFSLLFLLACQDRGIPPIAEFEATPDDGTRYHIFHFDATKTVDPDNPSFSLKFRWDFNGDGEFDTDFSDLRQASYKYFTVDCYTVMLQVLDPEGNVSERIKEVCLSDRNNPPFAAVAIYPHMASLGTTIKIDASASFDWEERADSLIYKVDVDSDGLWDNTDFCTPFFTHRYDTPGYHTILVQVEDGEGAFSQQSKIVEVANTYNEYGYFTDYRDGETYASVKLGEIWVMAENLRYGDFVRSMSTPLNNGLCEVFAYNDDQANIASKGGLYLFGEIMDYSTEEEHQGLCPDGWHVPSDPEWKDLEAGLGFQPQDLDKKSWDRGEGYGTYLRKGEMSGFGAEFFGMRLPYGLFSSHSYETLFWTSTMLDDGSVWVRALGSNHKGIGRFNYRNNYGFSVRCFKDSGIQGFRDSQKNSGTEGSF